MALPKAKSKRRPILCSGKPVSLIVLAGGRSRRMGRSKALLPVEGRTLLEHVLAQVEGYFDDIVISLSPGQKLTLSGSARRTSDAGRSSRGPTDRGSHRGLPRGRNEARCRSSGHLSPGCGWPDKKLDKKKEIAAAGRGRLEEQAPPPRFVRDAVPGQGPMAGVIAGLKAARHDVCVVVACDIPHVPIGLLRRLARTAGAGYEAVVPVSAEGLAEPLFAVYRRTVAPHMEGLLASGRRSLLPLLETAKTFRVPLGNPAWLKNLNTPGEYRAFLESVALTRRSRYRKNR